jgi:phosphoglycolate phosphatase
VVPLVGFGSLYLVQRCLAPAGEMLEGQALETAHARYLQHYNAHLLDRTHLHDGALAMLERYRTRCLAVVTNKLEAESRRILAGLGVLERFAVIVGGDTLAEKKPDPLPLRHVMKIAGAAPAETVMIGDGVNDVLAGKAAGVHTVAVTFGVDAADALRALEPGYMIDHMRDLQNLIG